MQGAEKLLTADEVSDILGITPTTLSVWRSTKRYQLPWVKVGGRIRYRLIDVQKFIESRIRGSSNIEKRDSQS